MGWNVTRVTLRRSTIFDLDPTDQERTYVTADDVSDALLLKTSFRNTDIS
jgi:hypothetical protein